MPTRNLRSRLIAAAACTLLLPLFAAGEDEPRPTLRLNNGGYVSGRLLASDDPAEIVWQGDGFVQPFRFPQAVVHSLQFPRPAERADAPDGYCFELSGGDMLSGALISLDERAAVVEIPAIGRIAVDRSALLRFYRTKADDLIYFGPDGLDGWTTSGEESAWRDDGGQIRTNAAGATIGRNDLPPPSVSYEIGLAWSDQPDFEFVAGLSKHAPGRTAFRLETWGNELVVTRESDRQADVKLLQKIAPGAGATALSVLFDEAQGRLLVYSAAGEPLADFVVPPDEKPPRPQPKPQFVIAGGNPAPQPELPRGLVLTNRRGSLTLAHLAIRRWSGIAPRPAESGKASISLSEGRQEAAEVLSFDGTARQLVIFKDGQEQRIDERLLEDVVLRQRDDPRPRSVRVLLVNGARIGGDVQRIETDALVLTTSFSEEPLSLPRESLQAVAMLASGAAGESSPATTPRLELPGVLLKGSLQEARHAEHACLVFQPLSCSTSSPLDADVSGRYVLRDAPPPPKPAPQPNGPQQVIVEEPGVGQLFGGLRRLLGNAKPALGPRPPGDCLLHLRSGDTFPCRVQLIDERGVTFQSALTEAEFVPHSRIKALELRLDARPVKIEKSRFDRLLTLPRLQRDNPAEQLVRSLEGDYLRCRLISMNEKDLEIEVRLDVRKIPRDQVTRILWLHPDESAKARMPPSAETTDQHLPAGIRVQAVPRSGNRLTFHAQELAGKILSGRSELLGACHVDLAQIDQLLIGEEIGKAAATLAFHQWRLRAAAEPLPDPDPDADPGSGGGMESVLVGKPAPAIELDLLTGGQFRLAECKDKVVVLDFWASWCGPCLQAMPQVDRVVAEFAEQGVQLVAINVEETPEQVRTALSRLKLETAVALDKNGRVAERYGVTDFPQTVIIGRDGKIARLFVGGGARFDERIRQALKAMLED